MGFFKDLKEMAKEIMKPPVPVVKTEEEIKAEQKAYQKQLKEWATCPKCGYYGEETFMETQRQIDQLREHSMFPWERTRRRYRCPKCDHGWTTEWTEWKELKPKS